VTGAQKPAVLANVRADRRHLYDEIFPGLLDERGHHRAAAAIRAFPGYAPTPFVTLPRLAAEIGAGSLDVKYEAPRFGLGSFKALGGAYAVYCAVARAVRIATERWPDAAELVDGAHRDIAASITVTCASEGNHGRSVAWGAQLFGCRAVIYLPHHVAAARVAAIAQHGAAIVRVPGTYDDAVLVAERDAEKHGRTIVSDTAYANREDSPVDVMQGYTVLAQEMMDAWGAEPPTHVFVQAGVGGLAAAVAAHLWRAYGPVRPRFVVVEPAGAACVLESARAGVLTPIEGEPHTNMSCLACAIPSTIAWRILDRAADAFVAIDDDDAIAAVRRLAGSDDDQPIVTSESGAAAVGALLALTRTPSLRVRLGLGTDARIACIVSEGANDPERYAVLVGG